MLFFFIFCLLASASAGASEPSRYVRARGDRFEVVTGNTARPMFIRGINLGAGSAGHFPGEFAITKADYVRWIRFARTLHANAIRVYALHPPAFYEALKEENQAHPRDPIWLFQEVWTELPEKNDFWDPAFMEGFESDIKLAMDAIHGNAMVPPRPGHASGRYAADVSPYVAGWLLGREWEPYAVRVTQRKHPGTTSFRGAFFSVENGTPMECWLGRELELAASYEAGHYGLAHALSFVNWPTLDVMRHPTETEPGGQQADHDEDAFSVDPARIRPMKGASPLNKTLGYFANYHVYPYYPDFMNLDPGYSAYRDKHGACNYAGYLSDLKAHTRGIPLLVGEFGVPTSRGVAHLQPQGINHGGMSEEEQGKNDVRLLEDIQETGCAGGLLFALFDEWFKVNWLVARQEQPRERDPLWHNLLDPEENYGLLSFDPAPSIHVDGRVEDWSGIMPYATTPAGPLLRALYATSDQNRFYLRIDLAPGPQPTVGVALDVLDPARGDRRLPRPLKATWNRGAEFVLLVQPGDASHERRSRPPRAELFIDRAMNYSRWSREIADGHASPHLGPLRPVANEDGRYIPLIIETNRERVSRSGKIYPPQHLDWGRLEFGREPARAAVWPGAEAGYAYDPHAEWTVDDAGRTIEIAIPWGLLNVGDPSSRSVLDDKDGTSETEVSRTSGIGLLAWATRLPAFRADSLGPSPARASPLQGPNVQFMGAPGTTQASVAQGLRITSSESRSYVWNGWEVPMISERIKKSARFVRETFEGMEARDQRNQSDLDAKRE